MVKYYSILDEPNAAVRIMHEANRRLEEERNRQLTPEEIEFRNRMSEVVKYAQSLEKQQENKKE